MVLVYRTWCDLRPLLKLLLFLHQHLEIIQFFCFFFLFEFAVFGCTNFAFIVNTIVLQFKMFNLVVYLCWFVAFFYDAHKSEYLKKKRKTMHSNHAKWCLEIAANTILVICCFVFGFDRYIHFACGANGTEWYQFESQPQSRVINTGEYST